MATTYFKKIAIYAWKPLQEDLLKEIQRLGIIEFIDEPDADGAGNAPDSVGAEKFQMARFCLQILNIFSKKSFLDSFVPSKIDIQPQEYYQTANEFPLAQFHKRCRDREERLKTLGASLEKMKADYEKYIPWSSLDVPISGLRGTKSTSIHPIRINKKNLKELIKNISGYGFVEAVSETKNTAFCLAGCIRQEEDSFFSELGELGAEIIPLDSENNYMDFTPREAMRNIASRINTAEQEEKKLNIEKQEDSAQLRKTMILCDHFRNIQNRRDAAAKMRSTEEVFSCKGWIPAKHLEKLKKTLDEKFPESFFEILRPEEGEQPPVELTNPAAVKPFETITGLYGMPARGELDPTPFLAPFFVLFFAICMTDAGYGAAILIASILLAKKLKLGAQALRFVNLLSITGIMTIVVGALTGGFFGIQPDQVPESLSFLLDIRGKIMLFDPMEQFLLFMLISLALGFLQVWFGYVVKLIQDIKTGRTASGLFEQIPWIIVLPGFVLLGITKNPETVSLGLIEESPLGAGWETAAKALIYAGIAGMFIRPGEGGFFKKTGAGIYSLYGLIGCLGDILSYVRLFALGLATVAMAIAINTMAEMAGDIPVIGVFAAVVIATVGHIGNIAINALSAFIHTVRLQFVEFFTKFYQGGGKNFRPFSYETEFIENKDLETTN